MVDIQNLVKKYGKFTAVDRVTFDVPKGEVFALLGPNGCGKTTILRMMMGLLKPTSGSILIDGGDIARNSVKVREKISYLPQHANFPENLTGKEILGFYCKLRRTRMDRLESIFSLKGMQDFLAKPVGEYSGGMQQRLALAITLLPQTDILILDEPTASLDPEAVYQFRHAVRELCGQGKTVILATHLLSESEAIADRVAIMHSGRMISLKPMKKMKEEILPTFKFSVTVGRMHERFRQIALENGALDIENGGREMVFSTGRPEDRLIIINALQNAGASIERFGTVEPPLEEVYMKILQERED
ncbi:MAG: ABC transporter ATP-binding protein [Desulfomonilia bacterium]